MSSYKQMDRKSRGNTQQIFLIETHPAESELVREYSVMGTTGNVYRVSIQNTPKCTCPDYQFRSKRCKHIYFVLLRIMRVAEKNVDKTEFTFFSAIRMILKWVAGKNAGKNVDKTEFTDAELKQMYQNIPAITAHLQVDETVRTKYRNMATAKPVTMQSTDDVCAICLDDLDSEQIDYCKYSCGKPIHAECFRMYGTTKSRLLCIFCKASWNTESTYINLKN